MSGGTLNAAGNWCLGEGTASGNGIIDLRGNAVWTGGNAILMNLAAAATLKVAGNAQMTTGNGTIGTGNNSASVASVATIGTGMLTLNGGTTIDYSINGETGLSDQWITNAGLTLDAGASYSLIVDVVAGDVKQSAGPWTLFDNVGTINNFVPANWTITAADGTRLSSTGTLSLDALDDSKLILSGFEAFSIPEPSTAMLLGMGAVVMLLRRRIKR